MTFALVVFGAVCGCLGAWAFRRAALKTRRGVAAARVIGSLLVVDVIGVFQYRLSAGIGTALPLAEWLAGALALHAALLGGIWFLWRRLPQPRITVIGGVVELAAAAIRQSTCSDQVERTVAALPGVSIDEATVLEHELADFARRMSGSASFDDGEVRRLMGLVGSKII